jgi:serine/threonine protein phosphatase PrpC
MRTLRSSQRLGGTTDSQVETPGSSRAPTIDRAPQRLLYGQRQATLNALLQLQLAAMSIDIKDTKQSQHVAAATSDATSGGPNTLAAWRATDVGMVREHNEDSSLSDPAQGFFIVADGMGGHAAGEVASAMTVASVSQTLTKAAPQISQFIANPDEHGRKALVQMLQGAVLSAHQAVFARGVAEPDKHGMGTTLDVLLIAGSEAFVAHVGDSRTYLIRDGEASQITTDHTVAEVLVIEGKLTPEEAAVSPMRTILVNAIGVSSEVGVEMAHLPLRNNDRILMCSDGLHDYFPTDMEIAAKLSVSVAEIALNEMVELAKERGGHDNITGIIVQVGAVAERVRVPSAPVAETIEREETQPVELAAETDLMDSGLTLSRVARQLRGNNPRITQPLRAIRSRDGRQHETPPVGIPTVGDSALPSVNEDTNSLSLADTIPPQARMSIAPLSQAAELPSTPENNDDGDK